MVIVVVVVVPPPPFFFLLRGGGGGEGRNSIDVMNSSSHPCEHKPKQKQFTDDKNDKDNDDTEDRKSSGINECEHFMTTTTTETIKMAMLATTQ